eukprot:scaffold5558_cov30-Tisochrysis_lutea.AAC.2
MLYPPKACRRADCLPHSGHGGKKHPERRCSRFPDHLSSCTGPLELTLEPLAKGTELVCVRLDMPLGMLLEEETPATFEALSSSDSLEGSALNEGEATPPVSRAFSPMPVVVAELFDGSAAKRGGVQVGDIVRACTFMSMAMSYPT